jgi:uncharacterized protein
MYLSVRPTDSEHRGYYEEAKLGRLVVQRCASCSMLRGATGAACPFCTSPEWNWHPVSGKGTIYSWQIVMQAVDPAFTDSVPYAVVLVELDEQRAIPWADPNDGEAVSVRVIANLCGADQASPELEENIAIGKRVEVCFIDIDETRALPQFRLVQD